MSGSKVSPAGTAAMTLCLRSALQRLRPDLNELLLHTFEGRATSRYSLAICSVLTGGMRLGMMIALLMQNDWQSEGRTPGSPRWRLLSSTGVGQQTCGRCESCVAAPPAQG